jgi:dipeptidase
MLIYSKTKTFLFVLFWILLIFMFVEQPIYACSTLIAGKKTTRDGSILFAKTEDDNSGDVDYLWYVPAQNHKPGSMIQLKGGNQIPQVLSTYGYFWDQCPGTEYSNSLVNEWGVAFGSDGCSSREDSVGELEKRGYIVKGGIGWRLRFILAERCKTARQAVELAAKLLDEYGYRGSGRNLSIVDPKEAWILQMVRGKQYVARKVGDDEVVVVPNTYTIREVDQKNRDQFICSPDLILYAIKRGWYDPGKDGHFDFARVYSHPKALISPENTRRHWMMARMVNRSFPLSIDEADKGLMPVAIKSDRKLELEDIFAIFRSHFEGTELDTSKGYTVSPHKNPNRPVCVSASHRTTVVQQRDWLPREIGTVVWRALGPPCSSGFVPWYLGVRTIPEAFQKSPQNLNSSKKDLLDFHFSEIEAIKKLDLNSSSCVFGIMSGLVDADYKNVIAYVRNRWKQFEHIQFDLQPAIENTALDLYKKDRNRAIRFLSTYTHGRSSGSLAIARSIINTLQQRLWKFRYGTPLYFRTKLAPEVLKKYAGTYEYTYENEKRQFKIMIKDEDIFYIHRTGARFLMYSQSESLFYFVRFSGAVTFTLNEKGKIMGGHLMLGEEAVPATKIDK